MHYLIRTRPEPSVEGFGEVYGAYVNCRLDVEDALGAEDQARDVISSYGWSATKLEDSFTVERAQYSGYPDSPHHYEQAERDGECHVLHMWPADARGDR